MIRFGIGILACFLTVGLASAEQPEKKSKEKDKAQPGIAHIKLSGDLDESPIGESPFGGSTGENLKMKLDRIKKAKTDANVKALFIEIADLEFGLFSFGKVEEVRRTIADFRQSGKKAYAYTESIGGLDYLIALSCDEICIPIEGEFGFLGLRIEMSFYKDMLDKIHIKGNFLTQGEAKGAAEPFTRNSMSPENKKQYDLVLDDLYENGVIATMIASRPEKKWTPQQVKQIIDSAPYTARKAKELGLLEHVAYREAFEEMIKKENSVKQIVENYGKVKPQLDDNPFTALMKIMQPPKKAVSKKDKIAVIYAIGGIESGKGGGGFMSSNSIGSDTFVAAIKKANEDETVKAIVLRVDSPGGSALASDLIWNALKKCNKPTIASMGDIAASGGYYISMGCNKIYAEPGTLTGSIGVVGGKIVTGGLFDWVGIKTEVLARGANSGIMSSNTPFSPKEEEALNALMKDIYDQFLDKTLMGREAAGVKLSKEKLLTLAGGRIWTGRQAKGHGLVDELGTLDDAIAEAKKTAKLEGDPELLILPEPVNFLDKLLEGEGFGLTMSQKASLLKQIELPREVKNHMRAIESILNLRNEKVWLMTPTQLRVR